jgi:purine catabolism regulator
LRTLLASDLGVHRLLGRFAADPELAAFVDEQLGPLLDHDAARGRELVRTLDTLLACGLSKAATARALGIRRQTLYQRLATVSALLGGLDLTSRERRTAIDLALVGWRLRTAAVPATGG